MTNTNLITFDLAWYHILNSYSAAVRRKVCDAVLGFAATGEKPHFKGVAKIAFELIANEISKQMLPQAPQELSNSSEVSEISEVSEYSESSDYSESSEISEISEFSESSAPSDSSGSEPLEQIAEIREILEKANPAPPAIVKAIVNPEGSPFCSPMYPLKTSVLKLPQPPSNFTGHRGRHPHHRNQSQNPIRHRWLAP